MNPSLFNLYFDLVKDTESPIIYHRWALVGSVGAALGRQFYLPFGMWRVFPNMYIMLIGSPGARKSAAIKVAKTTLRGIGYSTFAAEKTTKEKFLLDLEGDDAPQADMHELLTDFQGAREPKEIFIAADEFNEFLGGGGMEFPSLLGTLWDWDSETDLFKQRLKNSKSVAIFQPTVSLLSANTHSGFAEVFPPQAIGQGFLSRLILVYGERTEKRITFPEPPAQRLVDAVKDRFLTIRTTVRGPATLTPASKRALDVIYKSWVDLEDARFKHYSTRRFTHLLKLCLICTACRLSTVIEEQDVLLANSILSFTEIEMPKALGEFGKNKHSEAAGGLMNLLYEAKQPIPAEVLWKRLSSDFESMKDLLTTLQNLQQADKIQYVRGQGFLPKLKAVDTKKLYVDFKLLREYRF